MQQKNRKKHPTKVRRLTVTFLLCLMMFSVVLSVGNVNANPNAFRFAWLSSLPTSPVTDKPIVTASPLQVTFEANTSTDVSIHTPNSWWRPWLPNILSSIGCIKQITCIVDEKTIQTLGSLSISLFHQATGQWEHTKSLSS
jgi:hypothetical protein